MVMHYFHPVLEHGIPPSLNLNYNAYSVFPRIHVRRERMARGLKGTLQLCQSLVNGRQSILDLIFFFVPRKTRPRQPDSKRCFSVYTVGVLKNSK